MTSLELPFDFIKKLKQNGSDYKERYLSLCCSDKAAEDVEDLPKNENRRKDYLFLLKLTKSVIHLRKHNRLPWFSGFPNQPPSVSNARWNSKAIYSLLAEYQIFLTVALFAYTPLLSK